MDSYKTPKYSYGIMLTPSSNDLTLSSGSQHDKTLLDSTKQKTSAISIGNSSLEIRQPLLESTNKNNKENTSSSHNSASDLFRPPLKPTFSTPRTPAIRGSINKSSSSKKTPLKSFSKTPKTKTPKSVSRTPKGRTSDTPKKRETSVIVALVEGRGLARGEIGMASIDLKDPTLSLSQFSDSQTYVKTITMLQLLAPVEILFPSTMCDNGNRAKVFKVVSENFENGVINTVQRQYFNEESGLNYVKKLVIKENSSVVMDVRKKYYCLASCSALIKYIEYIQNTVYALQSLRVVYNGSDQTTLIDANTALQLELTRNLKNPKNNLSLYGVLNHTSTPGGARMLRSNILQPPNDLLTIQARLDCVTELSTSSELFNGVQSVLKRFHVDLDHLLALLVQIPKEDTDKTRESRLNSSIFLKHVTELVPVLLDSLSNAKSDLLKAYRASLHDNRFAAILEILESIMNTEVRYDKGNLNMRMQRCFAVKIGVNGVLDLSRTSYSELIDDVDKLLEQLGEKYKLTLRNSYSSSRGFHIQLPHNEAENLPDVFIKVTRTKKTISCTTEDLVALNSKIDQSVRDINSLADLVITKMLQDVRMKIGCLYNLSEVLSTLDMLLAFAHCRTTSDYVRPEFTDTLGVEEARHPVLEKMNARVIPNDIYASDCKNFTILTGPNMSGKSTYLKTIAILQVMAQIGCYVSAKYASFRITDQIFSRTGADDDIETNASTFMLEMKETNYIIQNMNSNSLIIIDELGRGTSTDEGVGLCWAISEFLLSQRAYTFFATHFLELCRLKAIYPNVKNSHFQIKPAISKEGCLRRIIYTHQLVDGFTKETHYGLQLAEHFNLPQSVLKEARALADAMEDKSRKVDASCMDKMRVDNSAYRFATRLLQVARSSRLDDDSLQQYLTRLQQEYKDEIEDSNQVQDLSQ